MVERIRELCKQKGTSFAALEKRLGMGNATLKKANNKMQAVRLKALADYFGVSMEYLLTGAETPQDALTAQERELLHLFRYLNSTGQIEALKRITELTELDRYVQKNTGIEVG